MSDESRKWAQKVLQRSESEEAEEYYRPREERVDGKRRPNKHSRSSTSSEDDRSESEYSSSDSSKGHKKMSPKKKTKTPAKGKKPAPRGTNLGSHSSGSDRARKNRDVKPRMKKSSRISTAAAAIGVSLNDALANIAGQRDALREMEEDLRARKQGEEDAEADAATAAELLEIEEVKQGWQDKIGSMHYWYYDDVPRSKMFVIFFSLIFTISLFCFGVSAVREDTGMEHLWKWFVEVLGALPLPGPLPLGIKLMDLFVDSFRMYDTMILSTSWALTGAFMADFTYCLIFGKRFFLWPRARHDYRVIRMLDKEETKQDVRTDSNGRGDNKHLHCMYAEVQYSYTLGLYQTTTNLFVSMEMLSQLSGPRIMNLLTDDDMIQQKLVAAGGAMDTVNINRGLVYAGINVCSNTQQLAYGFYRHFRRSAVKLPFGKTPLRHI
jgi:hypothetical protein